MLTKKRLPSAAAEFKWFCETYGVDAAEIANKWVNALVASASAGKQLASIKLEGLAEELLSDAPESSGGWMYSMNRFRESTAREKLLALYSLVKDRAPPWESFTAMREIICLGKVPVELYAFYEVDRASGVVVFTKFECRGVTNTDAFDG